MNKHHMKTLLAPLLLLLGFIISAGSSADDTPAALQADNLGDNEMVVYKSASCGCCGDWVEHMSANGFKVKVHNTDNLNLIKQQAGLTPRLASCHTAFVGGYVIEGHVPASDVKRLLSEKPAIKWLTVPGMPAGANVPGMEVSEENATFDVLGFQEDGTTQRWNHYQ